MMNECFRIMHLRAHRMNGNVTAIGGNAKNECPGKFPHDEHNNGNIDMHHASLLHGFFSQTNEVVSQYICLPLQE